MCVEVGGGGGGECAPDVPLVPSYAHGCQFPVKVNPVLLGSHFGTDVRIEI